MHGWGAVAGVDRHPSRPHARELCRSLKIAILCVRVAVVTVLGGADGVAEAREVCMARFNLSACDVAIRKVTSVSYGGRISEQVLRNSLWYDSGASGGCMAAMPGCTRGLAYAHVRKSAGKTIMSALAQLRHEATTIPRVPPPSMTNNSVRTPPIAPMPDSCWKSDNVCAHVQARDHRPYYFTFVRHPIDHFVSGYAEMEARVKSDPSKGRLHYGFSTVLLKHPLGSRQRAVEFVRQFLCGTLRSAAHVGLQVSAVFACPRPRSTPFDFIGQLESIHDDWARIGHAAACPALTASMLPDEDWHVNSSSRSTDSLVQSVREAMYQALLERPLRSALEGLLAADFFLLNYTLTGGAANADTGEWCKESYRPEGHLASSSKFTGRM